MITLNNAAATGGDRYHPVSSRSKISRRLKILISNTVEKYRDRSKQSTLSRHYLSLSLARIHLRKGILKLNAQVLVSSRIKSSFFSLNRLKITPFLFFFFLLHSDPKIVTGTRCRYFYGM